MKRIPILQLLNLKHAEFAQIGVFTYKVTVLDFNIPEFQLELTLMPTGKDVGLPSFQLTSENELPEWFVCNEVEKILDMHIKQYAIN